MRQINGLRGGGQILRTALTLSAISGDNFEITNIRGSRTEPGLKRQHLKCVESVGRLCDAKTEGAETGSEKLVFKPGNLRNESFTVNIGTAGSATLLLDSIIPVATQFDSKFRLDVKGGTDVKWSPPYDSFNAKIQLLKRFGAEFGCKLERTGYYPRGNGEIRFSASKPDIQRINLTDRGRLNSVEIFSKASEELENNSVADRQSDELARKVKNNYPSLDLSKNVSYVESDSIGSTLVMKANYENSIAVFDQLGEKGKRSEEVAANVFSQFSDFERTEAAVDENLADQLMIFVALIGGEIRVPSINDHIQTNLETIKKFDYGLELDGKIIRKK